MINRKIILSSVIAGVVSLSASHHVTAALPNFQQGQEGVHVNNQNMQVVQQRPPVKLPHHIAMNVLQAMPIENVTVNNQNTGQIGEVTPIEILSNFAQINQRYGDVIVDTRINTLPIKKLDDKNKFPNMQTQVFYAENDFRLPTYEEIKEARDILIFVDMFGDNFGYDDYQINRFRNIRAEEPTIVHARFEYPMDMTYNAVQNIVASDGQHYDKMKFKNVSMKISEALAIPLGAKGGQYALHYSFDTIHNINRFYLDKEENQEILITKLEHSCIDLGNDVIDFGEIVDLSRFHYVRILGSYLFDGCPNLTHVKLPKNSTEIAYRCFTNCPALTTINLKNIKLFGTRSFQNCLNLQLQVDSLKNAEKIQSFAFNCPEAEDLDDEVTPVQINELDLRNLTSIQRAFARRGLQRVTLSENMYDRVPEDAFDEKVVITYVNAKGQQVFQETGADIRRKEADEEERLFKDFRNLFN